MNNTDNTKKTFVDFDEFSNDRDRIKYASEAYRNMDLYTAFSEYYNIPLNTPKDNINIINIEIGRCYWGTVTEFNKNGIRIVIPGVKEEIVSKENFNDCSTAVRTYLTKHDNKIFFEVREKRHNIYYVSIVEAYYKLWHEAIVNKIKSNRSIDVHIDSLTKGGYLCHTPIEQLNDLTGKYYTSSVFIPGSNIVLNIEKNFERWVGEDVQIIPQKFVKFRQVGQNIETSLIGSRKMLLQQIGVTNLHEIYNTEMLIRSTGSAPLKYVGTVTGIINSNKKTGIFVELEDKYITGLMPIDASELLNYRPGDKIWVKIKEFEIQEGKDPFVFGKNNKVIHTNTRCIFEQA